MKNGFNVAIQAKYRVDDFKGILNAWLFEKGKFPNDLKVFILQFMLDTPQMKKGDFGKALKLVERIGSAHSKKITDYLIE